MLLPQAIKLRRRFSPGCQQQRVAATAAANWVAARARFGRPAEADAHKDLHDDDTTLHVWPVPTRCGLLPATLKKHLPVVLAMQQQQHTHTSAHRTRQPSRRSRGQRCNSGKANTRQARCWPKQRTHTGEIHHSQTHVSSVRACSELLQQQLLRTHNSSRVVCAACWHRHSPSAAAARGCTSKRPSICPGPTHEHAPPLWPSG